MERRQFLKTLGATAVGTTAVAGAAQANHEYEFVDTTGRVKGHIISRVDQKRKVNPFLRTMNKYKVQLGLWNRDFYRSDLTVRALDGMDEKKSVSYGPDQHAVTFWTYGPIDTIYVNG